MSHKVGRPIHYNDHTFEVFVDEDGNPDYVMMDYPDSRLEQISVGEFIGMLESCEPLLQEINEQHRAGLGI